MLASPPAAPAAAYLSFDGVAHEYEVRGRAVPALAPVDLDVRPGELLSIIGPSGCGKSTLLRIAGGLLAPTQGAVRIGGASPRAAQRAKQIGFVFQDPSLLPWRTVAANVRLASEVNRRPGSSGPRAEDLLALVGLDNVAGYYPHQLSGGMRQRAALARALALNPPLLLMDEPFGALDEITRTELRYELLRLRRLLSATVLFVTHSIAEAVLLSDRVAVMSGAPGRVTTIVDIELPEPRGPEIEETPEFLALARRLRAALKEG